MTPEEPFELLETAIEKNNGAIRDLIVVSRTVLTPVEGLKGAQADTLKSIQELREAQATTDEKLNILIHTVDRVIRQLGRIE